MLTILQGIALWAGPIAAILNCLIALVGVPVAFWKGRQARDAILRWFSSILGFAQAASTKSEDAAAAADKAAAASDSAKAEAKSSGAHLMQASERLDVVGARLRDVLQENRGMARRLDDLLSAYVRLHALAREQGLQLPADLELEETQALTTITGRHHLRPPR